jgi:hypothetical protein
MGCTWRARRDGWRDAGLPPLANPRWHGDGQSGWRHLARLLARRQGMLFDTAGIEPGTLATTGTRIDAASAQGLPGVMLIFGRGRKAIWHGTEPANASCDHCGQKELRPTVIQRWVHFFWIPLFPTGKEVHFQCAHCQRTVEYAPGERALDVLAQTAKSSARAPIYLFAGLAIFMALVGVGIVKSRADARNTRAWVAAPAVGDLYVVNAAKVLPGLGDDDYEYVVARVDAVTPDGVQVRFGAMGYRLVSHAKKAIRKGEVDKRGYLVDEPVELPRAQLQTWLADGHLTDVLRE